MATRTLKRARASARATRKRPSVRTRKAALTRPAAAAPAAAPLPPTPDPSPPLASLAGGGERKPSSQRRRYTEELLADVRRRYEQTGERLADMAADMDLHRSTLQCMAQDLGWVRYVPPPRDLPEPARLRRRVEALAAAAQQAKADGVGGDVHQANPPSAEAPLPPTPDPSLPLAAPMGGGEQIATANVDTKEPDASPQQIAQQIEQMLREVQGQLDGLAALRAQNAAAMTHSEITAASRAVNTLAATLRALQRMRGAPPAPAAPTIASSGDHHDDDMPRDIDEFRRDLAQRIAAIMASWDDEEEPDEEAADAEAAEDAAAAAAAAPDQA